jgi:hypothetical protein
MHELETIAKDFLDTLGAAASRMRCVGIATVKTVSGSIDTAITLAVRPSIWRTDENGKAKEPPNILDVPLFCLNTGGWGVRMVPAVGDKVLLLVSDDCLTEWKSEKDSDHVTTKDKRVHAYTDALAIPFAHSTNSSSTKMLIGSMSGGTSIEISLTGITLHGNVDVTGLLRVGTANPAAAVTVNTHTHAAGTPNTGPPNPG